MVAFEGDLETIVVKTDSKLMNFTRVNKDKKNLAKEMQKLIKGMQ